MAEQRGERRAKRSPEGDAHGRLVEHGADCGVVAALTGLFGFLPRLRHGRAQAVGRTP